MKPEVNPNCGLNDHPWQIPAHCYSRKATFGSRKYRQNRGSFALILTLVILSLLTILLISYVSMVSQGRNATQNYSESIRAEQIALGGVDQVVSQLQAEATDPNLCITNGAGTNIMYYPKANTNAVPQRMVAAALAPMVTMSGMNVYSGATNLAALGSSTINASLNGRQVSIARWEESQLLLPAAQNTFISTPPDWIVVTRNGPQSLAAGASPQSAGLITSNLNNGTGVIGRYAYVVYDTSGLIDINVAGYPTASAGNASGKGTLPWADLTQLPGINTNDVQNLVNWRNAGSVSNYPAYVTNTASTNGFMQVANGDTTFFGRQDLIKWSQQSGNTDWEPVLPYLTTFSREVNGPTWGPTTVTPNINYPAQETTSGVQNPLIFNPRVQAAFTRNNGIEAVVGEPLVKYRFPLDKLELFNKMATTALTAQDVTDLQRYFGLDVATDSSGYYRHLNYPTANSAYPHGKGTSGATGIMTLDDVATFGNREPDFFELLQAGILQGSLGTAGISGKPARWDLILNGNVNGINGSAITDTDPKLTYQILRIGANIIDQWHADNYPTTITFTPAGSNSPESVYGICDLPYITQTLLKVYDANAATTPPSVYFYFQLWNPHQPSTYTASPTSLQISPEQPSSASRTIPEGTDGYFIELVAPGWSGTYNGFSSQGGGWFYDQPKSTYDSTKTPSPFYQYAANNGNIDFTISSPSYREPSLMTNNATPLAAPPWTPPTPIAAISITNIMLPSATFTDASQLKTGTNSVSVQWSDAMNTNKWANWNIPLNNPTSGNPTPLFMAVVSWQGVFRVQFQDPNNPSLYHTYSTFEGLDDDSIVSGFYDGGLFNNSQLGYGSPPSDANYYAGSSPTTYAYIKSDPRTYRFGNGYNDYTAVNADPTVGITPTAASSGTFTTNLVNHFFPFVDSGNYNSPGYRIDMWSVNNPSVPASGNVKPSSTFYITNSDGVVRPGDSTYSYAAANSYATPMVQGNYANRPVILHRPFNSVAELGYAFRDDPWKTLDFFSSSSADAGLLDLFTLSEAPVLAGRVSPNTPYAQVAAALISGATQSSSTNSASYTNVVTPASAMTLAQALTNVSSVSPFMSRADLQNRFMTNSALSNFSSIKTEREAVMRSLTESADTRTWNFLIDLIAQSGSYPASAQTLNNFVVTGERHYWLHVAIDRYTGQVVNKQLEVVDQ
jgi:Tfp pilus assembly protein PilX